MSLATLYCFASLFVIPRRSISASLSGVILQPTVLKSPMALSLADVGMRNSRLWLQLNVLRQEVDVNCELIQDETENKEVADDLILTSCSAHVLTPGILLSTRELTLGISRQQAI